MLMKEDMFDALVKKLWGLRGDDLVAMDFVTISKEGKTTFKSVFEILLANL